MNSVNQKYTWKDSDWEVCYVYEFSIPSKYFKVLRVFNNHSWIHSICADCVRLSWRADDDMHPQKPLHWVLLLCRFHCRTWQACCTCTWRITTLTMFLYRCQTVCAHCTYRYLYSCLNTATFCPQQKLLSRHFWKCHGPTLQERVYYNLL